jgi:hypothetical protein
MAEAAAIERGISARAARKAACQPECGGQFVGSQPPAAASETVKRAALVAERSYE